ncbi:hypothetical protein [Geotalea sp. SG265]|uniref:hypothetical protein n=1 Tax=Geotalea sp. SG265 TaxID=2922867 RepID=UPI001FAE8F68|nr:hypothetical protein [Geotalea sp. SG265]
MKSHWIRYRAAGTREIVHAHAEFTEPEIRTLHLFTDYADVLGKSRFFKGEQALKFQIRWSQSEGFSSENEMPDDDYISAFLHRMRPFILQDEKTQFYNICKILSHRLDHKAIRAKLKEHRKMFNGERVRNYIQISSSGTVVNSEETLNYG